MPVTAILLLSSRSLVCISRSSSCCLAIFSTVAEDTPILQVRDLDFSYGLVQVLFDVAVDVRPDSAVHGDRRGSDGIEDDKKGGVLRDPATASP